MEERPSHEEILIERMTSIAKEGTIGEVITSIDQVPVTIAIVKKRDGYRLSIEPACLDVYTQWFSSPPGLVDHLRIILREGKWFNRRLLGKDEYERAVTLYRTIEEFKCDSPEEDLCPVCYLPSYGLHLACDHRLCGQCLNKLVLRGGGNVISCPMCRMPHVERVFVNRIED